MSASPAAAITSRSALCAALLLLATSGWAQTPPPTIPKPGRTAPESQALAERVCDALQGLPARRKSECCSANAVSLAAPCARDLGASLARGAVTIDPAAVDRCAAETRRQLEGCTWVTPLLPAPPEACRGLVQGQFAAGHTCRSSLECRDSLYCRGAAPSREGTCSAPVQARARCEVPADNLLSFTRSEGGGRHPSCDGLCLKGQCLPFAAAGGACASSSLCAQGLHCISGRCQDQPLPSLGESCGGNTSCGSGAHCQAGRCAAVKGAGEACTLPAECRALACLLAPGEKVGTCAEPCGTPVGSPRKPAAP